MSRGEHNVAVRVDIVSYVDDDFPGWVACELTDASGTTWTFREKVPVVTERSLNSESDYPTIGEIACRVIEESVTVDGRRLVTVDTEEPWGIEATSGETRFTVNRGQLHRME